MLHKDQSSSYDIIKSCLEQELKDKKPRLELFSEPVPLLIMESQKDVAAFVVMNGSPRQLYKKAYEQFKKLYSERNKDWANRYLSFVLCRTDELTQEDSFYGELYNDAYFCKKYVIYLIDQVHFQQEIKHLPFIPLKRESIDALKRPVSAQTLLQKCGLDTKLARHLVKAKEEAANTIAKKYLAKDYDHNPFKKPEGVFQTTDDSVTGRSSTRLRSLTIENFRAYKHQEFDLSGDIIILYGPNGLGKTSFYDALDFACTGRIARLKGKIGKVAPHLDSEPGNSCVTIQVEKDRKTVVMKRTVDKNSYPNINEETVGRKELLSRLTGLIWEDTAKRVENLEKLFRATHLFGQDYQELLTDYRNNSELSEEIVARMLAFEDYVAAGKKSLQVIDNLEKHKDELSYRCKQLTSTLCETEKQRAELAKTIKATTTPETIKKLAREIADRVKQTLNIDLPIVSQIDKDEIRNWRSTLSGEIEIAQERLNRITIIEGQHQQIIKDKMALARKKKELLQFTDNIKVTTKTITNTQKEHEALLKTLSELTAKNNKLTEKHDIAAWHVQGVQKFRYLSEKKTTLLRQIEELSLSPNLSPEELKEEEARLLWLKENLSKWKDSSEEIKNKRAELNKVKEKLKTKGKQLNNDKLILKEKQKEFLKCEIAIKKLRKGESKLLALLDDAENLVEDAVCPVCGTDHSTKENLLQRIQQKKGKRPPENEAINKIAQKMQKEASDLAEKNALLENEFASIQEEEKNISQQVFQIERVIHEFQERAKQLNLEVDNSLVDTINNGLVQISILKEYKSISHDIEDIIRKAEVKKLPLVVDTNKLDNRLHNMKQEISKLQEGIASQEKHKKAFEEHLNLASTHLKILKERQVTSNTDISNLTRGVCKYEGDLARLDLNADASIETIQSKKTKLQKQTKKVNLIKDEIIRLETAIDSAQSSARLAELDGELAKTKAKLKEQEAKIEEINTSLDYFKQINSTLSIRKNTSVDEYTENLGPLAAIIQRRLREVYGFGPINLKSKGGKIYIQVSRKSETLRPIDYFSDSQNQILMLSLFMAAGMTQTWSSFAPILMDDPITHFDDLNAYAFVELIRGIVDDNKGQRQFIISTCDENLWNLFRQRFSSLNGKAIMYKFVAIGDEGPIVKRVS